MKFSKGDTFSMSEKFCNHKGQEGSDPDFPKDAPHKITCVDVIDDQVYMKCVCGLAWDFRQMEFIDININKEDEVLKFNKNIKINEIDFKNFH